jgi:hypothetical protein
MAKYMVRNGFNMALQTGKSTQYFEGGNEIELTPEQYNQVKHMVEEVKPVKEPKNATV